MNDWLCVRAAARREALPSVRGVQIKYTTHELRWHTTTATTQLYTTRIVTLNVYYIRLTHIHEHTNETIVHNVLTTYTHIHAHNDELTLSSAAAANKMLVLCEYDIFYTVRLFIHH